ncbi:MAG: hypothetical protein K8T10_06050 [Candidatus Eremiobacteraeota bacterium]|nr:hypothetical protein [Candidatus Eremiobacteraeota bacterium]
MCKYSFTTGISIDPDELVDFLNEEVNGSSVISYISHIYIENPFRLLLDTEKDRLQKEKKVANIAKSLEEVNIEPVFVFDYTCMGDHHLTTEFHRLFGKMLEFIDKTGIKSISLADLYLAGTFSSGFPPYNRFSHFKVYLSPHAKINHAVKFKYLDNIEYSMVTLHPDINYSYPEEELPRGGTWKPTPNDDEIRRAVKFAGADRIEILVNTKCIIRCPLEIFCNATRFHAEQEKMLPDKRKDASRYYWKKYRGWIEEQPELIRKIPIIPPERVNEFSALGVKYFKILNEPYSISDMRCRIIPYISA